LRRWAFLLVLLLGEALALSVSYDSSTLHGVPSGALATLVKNAGVAAKLGTIVLASFLLVAAASLRRVSSSVLAAAAVGPRPAVSLIAHLASFGVLAGLTVKLFGGSAALRPHGFVFLAGWLLSLVLVFATWLLALVPARALPRLARDLGGLLGASGLVGVVAFGAGRLSDQLWLPLRRLTFGLSSSALRVLVDQATGDPASLTFGTPTFLVSIAPQCSGYEGMGLNVVFLSVALWFFRDRLRFPRAFWLVPIGAAASFLVNVLRLVALVLVGTFISPDVAQGGFHSCAGTVLFCAVGLSIVALALRSPWLEAPTVAGAASEGRASNPAAPYLVPFLTTTAAGLVGRMFSSGTGGSLSVLEPALGLLALAFYWRVYRDVSWRPTWRGSGTAALAGLLIGLLSVVLAKLTPSAAPKAAADVSGVGGLAHVLLIVFVAPVTEELAFRGFLARRVSQRAFETLAPREISRIGVAVSTAAFGALQSHPIVGALAGLGYVLLYRARNRLADAIIAHVVTNALLLVAALVTRGGFGHF
jgi:exosortase E/protease (VPEID-CTERM system)